MAQSSSGPSQDAGADAGTPDAAQPDAGSSVVDGGPPATLVRVAFQAVARTVTGQPFGLTVPLDTPVTGVFVYNLATPDSDGSANTGRYVHVSGGAFTANFLGHQVTGSATPTWTVTTRDTLRVYDGPRSMGLQGGTMSFDGTPDSAIQMFLAVTPSNKALLPNPNLPDPWPAFNFGFLGDPHTFSITASPDNGMLLQLTNTHPLVAPTITTPSLLPDGSVGVAYSQPLEATGGTPPLVWSVESGSLPSEVALDSSSGVIAGTPVSATTANFRVRVTDADSLSAEADFILTITE